MIELGIKSAPESESISNLEQVGPSFTEIVYDPSRPHDYSGWTELFTCIRSNGIKPAFHLHGLLHGLLPGNIVPGIANGNKKIAHASMDRLTEAIHFAADHGAEYIIMHPGPRRTIIKNEQDEGWEKTGKLPKVTEVEPQFLNQVLMFSEIAQRLGTTLVVETVPPNVIYEWVTRPDEARRKGLTTSLDEFPPETLFKAGQSGVALCNDWGHTAAWTIAPDNQRKRVWNALWKTSNKLLLFTHVLHVNTIQPPFNGTDCHSDTLRDLPEGAVPNRKEIIKLLKLMEYVPHTIYALAEPKTAHRQNYKELKQLVTESGMSSL